MGHRAFVLWEEDGKWYYYYDHWGALNLHNAETNETPVTPENDDMEVKELDNIETFFNEIMDYIVIEAVWINDEAYTPIHIWTDDKEQHGVLLLAESGSDHEQNTLIQTAIYEFKDMVKLMFQESIAKVLTINFALRIIPIGMVCEYQKEYLENLTKKYYVNKHGSFKDDVMKKAMFEAITS